ncbi:MAG: hypothetical protein UT63_C0006G0022 [Candidatus Gottesmanbacteria bacterium GW2011_GWC2_39_8]|uniref:Uncharacterized protein n=1 Tax=Candidatus Gottesmanbacteria bacterium GW2011_GWC2_39_8 TaxID=1618450 RepID=A0A0G0Q176_9BACT|nr:MAG: hypothetical protein UT63_C0006G0022 [Candidatus Gottesmanbacteria bacterium GW2011_GWC2_39_8]
MEIKKEVAAGIGVSEADWDEPQGTKVVSRLKEIGAETVKEEMLNQNIAFQEQARLEAIKASGKTEAEFEALANKQTLLTEATSKLWEKRKIEKAKTLNPNFDRLEEPEKQKVLVQAEEDLLSTQVKYGLDLKDDFIPPETAEALIKTLDPVLDQAKKQLAHLEAELVGKNHGHPTELSTEIAAAIVQAGIVDHLIKHGKLNEQGKIYLLKQALRKVYEASDRYYSQTQDPKNPKDAKDLIKTNMPGLVEAIELHQNIPDGTSYVSQIVNETFVNGVPQEVQALLINRESSFADFLTLCEKAYSIKPNESLTFAERLKLVSGGELSKVLEVMKKFPNELHSIFFRVIGEMKLSEQQLTEGIFGAYNQETLELTKGLLERLQQASKGQRIANILIQALMIGSAVLPVAHQSLEGGDDNSDSVIGGKGGNTSGQR